MDDAYHYGNGVQELAQIVAELSEGSLGTGIGYAADKLGAYASDWDEHWENMAAEGIPISADHIDIKCWDIWRGGTITHRIPRVREDQTGKC